LLSIPGKERDFPQLLLNPQLFWGECRRRRRRRLCIM
jgi:hypothetical protein